MPAPASTTPDPVGGTAADVGFIGVGHMGSILGAHILASGRRVVAWDRDPGAVAAFAAAGGTAGSSIAAVARAPIVISMVFDDAGTREITLRPGGLVESLQPGAVHVVMASISPSLSRELAEAHEQRGQRYLAASVFGRPEAAQAAELHINCSGAQDAFDIAAPVLDPLGRVLRIGADPGQAMLVKSLGNSMITVGVEMLRETFAFLQAGGIDEATARRALIEPLLAGPMFARYAELHAEQPEALKMTPIAEKDRTNCLAAADQLQVDLPMVRFLSERNLP